MQISNGVKIELIMFNMSSFSEWQKGIANRNYHLFSNFRKSDKIKRIVSVDFLPFTFRRCLRNYWENILFRIKGEKIYQDLTTRCVKLQNESPAESYIFSSLDSFFSQEKFFNKLNYLLEKIGDGEKKIRIVWSCFPMFVSYFDKIKADLYIFDAVDNWLLHKSFVGWKKKLEENYKVIAERADLIFTVAEELKNFFKSLGREKDVYPIENGVDFHHFNEPFKNYCDRKFEKIKKPIIGYIGTIEERIDADLLAYLASENPEKSFVLIGPLWPNFRSELKKFRKFKNVHLLGRRPYQVSPYYLQNFEVAIIPHKMNEFMKHTSSLKLLEYFSAGKPVVSIPASGAEKLGHLVYLANNFSEFKKGINQALLEDSQELKEKRKEYALSNSWEKRVKEMIKIIKEKIL